MTIGVTTPSGVTLSGETCPAFVRSWLPSVAFWGSSSRLLAARVCYARGRTWTTRKPETQDRESRPT
jgi:hypothetical protein